MLGRHWAVHQDRSGDRAQNCLERAGDAHKDIELYLFKGDPLLKNLEGDPRYRAFLRKMNLPE